MYFEVKKPNKAVRVWKITTKKVYQKQQEYLEIALKKEEALRKVSEQANESKSTFLANMSHELRTPMHGIISYASMGLNRVEKSSVEKNKKYFSNIKLSSERLMLLLNDLLDCAKLETGKMEMNFELNSLITIAKSCVSEQEARLKEAEKLGFSAAIVPSQMKTPRESGIRLTRARDLAAVVSGLSSA